MLRVSYDLPWNGNLTLHMNIGVLWMYASNPFNLREVEKTQGRFLSLSLSIEEESFSTVPSVSIILFSPPNDCNPFWSTGKFNTFPFAL